MCTRSAGFQGQIMLMLFSRCGEPMSLNCDHQHAYCLSNHMIYGCREPRWNDTDGEKPKNSEKSLAQSHFFYLKSHMDWPWRKPGTPRSEAGD
jgi:hypothetical protein